MGGDEQEGDAKANRMAELEAELTRLRNRVRELERLCTLSPHDQLKLLILDRAPLTVWACDEELRIVLWSGDCPRLYGYAAAEAIGRDFVRLFVDELEQSAAIRDTRTILEGHIEDFPGIVWDRGADGKRLNIATNTFRVVDPESGRMLAAEIGLDVSDLGDRLRLHRETRAAEALRRVERDLATARRTLADRLQLIYTSSRNRLLETDATVIDWMTKVERGGGRRIDDRTSPGAGKRAEIQQRVKTLDRKYEDLVANLQRANKSDDLRALEHEIDNFDTQSAQLARLDEMEDRSPG